MLAFFIAHLRECQLESAQVIRSRLRWHGEEGAGERETEVGRQVGRKEGRIKARVKVKLPLQRLTLARNILKNAFPSLPSIFASLYLASRTRRDI